MVLDQAGASLARNSYVTLFPPGVTPRVLHNPSTILLIPNQKHRMVNLSVMTVIENTTDVELPLVGIN